MSNIRKRLADNLYLYRHTLHITQQELSAQANVNKNSISSIENMLTSTNIDIVERLAHCLRTDACLLLARSTIRFPKTGLKKETLAPWTIREGEAAYAFWTRDEGMEYHSIARNSVNNMLHIMALLQANGITGKDLLDKTKKIHIPYKNL